MICPNCGSEIKSSLAFCPRCGTRLSAKSNTPPVSPKPTPTPQKTTPPTPTPPPVKPIPPTPTPEKKSKLPIALAAVAILAIGIPAGILASNVLHTHKTVVNLNNYLTVEFEGEDGSGKVKASFNLPDLINLNQDAFKTSKKTRKTFAQTLGKEDVSDQEIYTYLFEDIFNNGTVSVFFNPENTLSNGDIVTAMWNCPESTLEELFPVDLICDDLSYKVSGLDEKTHEHTPMSSVRENEISATCTDTGSYDEVTYCSECRDELKRISKTIPKKDHTYRNGVCTECGEDDPYYSSDPPARNSYNASMISLPVGGLSADRDDFIFPDSSSRYLSYSDLSYILSYEKHDKEIETQMIINEIFARYGYTFTSSSASANAIRNKLGNKSWYIQAQNACPVGPGDQQSLIDNYMNAYEKANIKLINKWQKENIPQ